MTWFFKLRRVLRRLPPKLSAGGAAALLALSAASAGGAVEDVVMIINSGNPNPVDHAFIVQVYTGGIRGWPDGSTVLALDQSRDPALHEVFCLEVLRRRPATVRAIWSQNIFTGKASPPRSVAGDSEMKRLVAANRNAIGYIRSSQLDGSVRKVGDD